ncbi:MAG TPA: hypothetical protein VKM93_01315 [Terriglobia bacterium]|nr:hypothetical protein [Terriglobia bacterium]
MHYNNAEMGPEGKLKQVAKICITGYQDSLSLLRGLEYPAVRRTSKAQVSHVIAGVSFLAQ